MYFKIYANPIIIIIIIISHCSAILIREKEIAIGSIFSQCSITILFNNIFNSFRFKISPSEYIYNAATLYSKDGFFRFNQFEDKISFQGVTKYSVGCEIWILEDDPDIKSTKNTLNRISTTKRNPTFILIIGENLNDSLENYFDKLKLHRITLTSIYLFVNSNEIFIINQLGGTSPDVNFLIPVINKNCLQCDLINLEYLLKFYVKLFFNFHEAEISGGAAPYDFHLFEDIADIYNFSTTNKYLFSSYGHVQQNHLKPLSSEDIAEYFLTHSQTIWEWSPHGLEKEPYGYISISIKPGYDFFMLLKPFDKSTWILLIITVLIFAVTVQDYKSGQKLSNFFTVIFWAIGSLLEDYEPRIFKRLWKSSTQDLLLISTWLLGAIILTNGYKGCVFSFMSKIVEPQVPTSLLDLVKDDVKPACGLYSALMTLFSYAMKASSLDDALLLEKLKKKVVHIDDDSDVVKSVIREMTEENFRLMFGSNSQTDTLVLIGDKNIISYWRLMAIKFGDYSVVTDTSNTLGKLIILSPWIGIRNFFYPFFIDLVARYHESGIYRKGTQDQFLQLQFRVYEIMFQASKRPIKKENMIVFFGICGGKLSPPTPKPLSYQGLYMILNVYLILILIAVLFHLIGFMFLARPAIKSKVLKHRIVVVDVMSNKI